MLWYWLRYYQPLAAIGGPGAAPVLDWDDEADDSTPDFTVDFDEGSVVVDAVVTLQIDDNSSFTSPTETTDTLDAAEILAGAISMATGSLADGTYYARVKINNSAWSNTETITISGGGGGTAGQPIGLLLALTKAS